MKNELGVKNKKQVLKAITVEDTLNLPYEVRMQTSYVMREKQIQSRYGEPNLTRKAGEYVYEIRNIDDGSKLYVIYDSKNGKVHDIWRLRELFKKEDFDNIKINSSTFDDVNNIDEYCLYFGDEEGEGISEHRLLNNEVLIIHYIKNNDIATVKELEFITPDPSSFTTILKKNDLKQILPE
jgi:hypothetical protein